ncbi:arginine--tRNA ligase [Flagellimonas marinaquae]|uniref:Arginine--tRNA ligase n=1 Tax=Flagellimonas aurea TaxID=2915619 RepID=A0ABS3G6S8_9FLAO|nr:arginine--tRNA ligase [Allomuricauda aurea]MAO16012.1 arginine--tRNA ligase [Allomuricauda sp.]MBO0355132.1 arginine--tRNA ligase [Allomuricauda aurea]UBZ15060.1 arginine--tRNA ligase [Allomuricauda aquimarina]|tara:strand:- start:1098 stop:2876 length:1779 start_codon:yes stop_codon:yes gene_type:complete
MSLQNDLTQKVIEAVKQLYQVDLPTVEFQPTRKDFEGDITVVVFPMLRLVKGNPVQIGTKIGEYLVENVDEVLKCNVVQGFLNIVIADSYYLNFFNGIFDETDFGYVKSQSDDAVMVEYSSPNTNKPLHLGHIRNNLLGYSVAEILKASGKKVYKTQIINDRGIHICKSMLAWQKFGEGETPESSGLKGDHLVGKYYVAFDKAYKEQIAELVESGTPKEKAEKEASILLEAQEMLRKWEAGDDEVVALWKKMNGWVYDGFDITYKNLGVDFDTLYYESDTYLLGRDVVKDGLERGVFFKKEDGSVWIDLTEDGLDEKIVLRSDGTAVYMTQDIGTAIQRVTDHPDINGMVYTVGNEQDYHFKVLFLILKKLGYSWAEQLFHLSYGMVDLPSGKMKSREGTVVDADDLIKNMEDTAESISQELGKLEGYSEEEKKQLYRTIGLGALKYYILKVDPKKRILFNPEESVDFQGNTGPFIQYTYARIQSILRKADFGVSTALDMTMDLHEKEKELLKQIQLFPETVQLAAENFSPALIANYTYDLVKEFNSFYQQVSILGETDEQKKNFRVQLSQKVGEVIQSSFRLLGIDVPDRM